MDDAENKNAISCLQHALEDSQETLRAFDTKAEILAILLTLGIGITNFTYFGHATGVSKYLLAASLFFGLIAIGLLGFVLHPKSNLFKKINLGGYVPSESYFLVNNGTSAQFSVTQVANKALNTDWVRELTYENMKLAVIREYKRCWFITALKFSAVALLLITVLLGVETFK